MNASLLGEFKMLMANIPTVGVLNNNNDVKVSEIVEYFNYINSDIKLLLTSNYKNVLSIIDIFDDGLYSFGINNVNYELLYKKSKTAKLFVFLSGAGRDGKTETNFNRLSWFKYFDGHCLAIEDPMYKKYPGIDVGWYYGSQSHSYLIDIADIIQKFTFVNGINLKDVYFIGSSCAGYAAIYLANMCQRSTSIAMNPQLVPAIWDKKNSFQNNTNINLSDDDKLCRNNITKLLLNGNSRHILFVNTLSIRDYEEQIMPLFLDLGKQPLWGNNVIEKSNIILADLKNPFPHGAFLEVTETIMLIDAFNNGYHLSVIPSMLTMLRQKFDYKYKLFFSKSWSTVSGQNFLPDLRIPLTTSSPSTKIFLKNHYETIYYKFNIDHTQKKCTFSLFISNSGLSLLPNIEEVKNKFHSHDYYKFKNDKKGITIQYKKPFAIDKAANIVNKIHMDLSFIHSLYTL